MPHRLAVSSAPLIRQVVIGVALVLAILVSSSNFGSAADRPNILWITVEDMSPTLGCYGDEYADTPHVDALAKESVRYTNAFASSPVCSPSRSTLITGINSSSLGTMHLRSDFPLPSFVHAWPAALREAGYFTTNNVKTDYNTGDEPRLIAEAWDRNGEDAHWRQRRDGQPFFAIFNDMTTHQSRTGVWPRERFDEQVQSRLATERIHDPAAAPLPPYYPDTPEVRRGVARFYDCVSVMDDNVGRLLAQLREDGLEDETIVFFYADHGSGLPRGKRVLHDSGMRVPLLVRFPAKYRHLAPAEPGTTLDRLVGFVDFPPSVLSLLTLPIPESMQGYPFLGPRAVPPRGSVFGVRDRVDEAYDTARSVRDERYLYIRNFRPDLSLNQPTVYSDFSEVRRTITRLADEGKLNEVQLSYAGPARPAEELYDVVRDPHNIVNLADDPEYRDVLNRMRQRQIEWSRRTRDLGFVAEEVLWSELDDDEHASPYEWARSGEYDVDAVLAAADLVGRGSEDQLLALLESENPSVRLQGVLGLRARDERSSEAMAALRKAVRDESSAVRTEAAAVLGEEKPLVEELRSDDPNRVLRASRALELLGDRAGGHVKVMQSTLERWRDADGPLPLFIRFSLEAALTKLGHPPRDTFQP